MTKYKFTGQNGSMGYKTGKVYHGTIEVVRPSGIVFIPGTFPLNIFSGKRVIPYISLSAFHRNWKEA